MPDAPHPPTIREWVTILAATALTVLAYATVPIFWGG
jgi:hypothetical protein